MQIPEFKKQFIERYSQLTDWNEFSKTTVSFLRRSIRVNTLKSSVNEIKKRLKDNWELKQIPWCKQGFWISGERRDVGNLTEHALGYVYVQEAASMIPPLLLDVKKGDKVLDMAAAPGSKTTQTAALMDNSGMMIANEFQGARIEPLRLNLQRCGVTNTVITQMNGLSFKGKQFDRILLDAPCSGTGTIRKSIDTIQIWNKKMVVKIANMQKKLIDTAFDCVNSGGTLVYSTCSLEPEENEEVVDWLVGKNDGARVEKIRLDIKHKGAVQEFDGKTYDESVKNCLRLWPQDNDTEGFFVAKIKKR